MATGIIVRLLKEQGYGFIQEDGQRVEIEFHWTALTAGHLEQLNVGQRVSFDTRVNHREPEKKLAVNVQLIDS